MSTMIFLTLIFLIIFFFKEVQINKKQQLGILLKQMLILLQTLLVIEETSLRVFLLKTMKQWNNAQFRNNAPFLNCISKINGTLIDNAEGLDIAMPMYNLLEHSKNYSKITGSLWDFYRDEPTSDDEINHYLGPISFEFIESSIMENLGDINNDNQASKNEISLAWAIFGDH